MLSKVYTTAQVAELEGRDTAWISRACAQGLFPGAYRTGERGQWRIPEEAITAHRARQRRADTLATSPIIAGIERRSERSKRRRKQLGQ